MKNTNNKRFLIFILILLLAGIIFLSVNEEIRGGSIKNFEDCVAAGFPVAESYPRQCMAYGKTYVEDISNENQRIYCTPESRNVESCITIYQPVCGYRQPGCEKDPALCDSYQLIPITFPNSCAACLDESVVYYIDGECK